MLIPWCRRYRLRAGSGARLGPGRPAPDEQRLGSTPFFLYKAKEFENMCYGDNFGYFI